MADPFDPYYRWLGIPTGEQPADYYRLLGLAKFEDDPDVIDEAAERQIAHVRRHQLGPRAVLTQQLINELATARICLLDVEKKARYDSNLRSTAVEVRSTPNFGLPPVPSSTLMSQAGRLMPRPILRGGWLRSACIVAGSVAGIFLAVLLIQTLGNTAKNGDSVSSKSEALTPSSDADFHGTTAGETKQVGTFMKLAWCPAGKFAMGSPLAELHRDSTDEMQISVELSHGFWMSQTEVTQGQWERIMSSQPWRDRPKVLIDASAPASMVSWMDASKFCEQLTSRERRIHRLPDNWFYRLPSEAQWEYACRAGTTKAYSFGDDVTQLTHFAWYGGRDPNGNVGSEKHAHRVAKKRPNQWNLFDMHGNVWEWCRDNYAHKMPGGIDPLTAPGSTPVMRGGCWHAFGKHSRSADRHGARNPEYYANNLGFRIICEFDKSGLSTGLEPK